MDNLFNNIFDEIFSQPLKGDMYQNKSYNLNPIESSVFDVTGYRDIKVTQGGSKFQIRTKDKNEILYSEELPYSCKIYKVIKKDNLLIILFNEV